MAPQWSAVEDRALLLALVQAMAPTGPSKHQFEAAVKATNDRWTVSAVSQHYNKKLRVLSPLDTLDDANTDTNPSTPVRSVAKRKTPTPSASARGGKTPTPSTSARGGKKKAPAMPRFPNLKGSEKAGEVESEEEAPKAKKLKASKGKAKGESEGEGEGEEGGDE